MSTAQSDKATFSRIHDVANSGDLEVIARTIDEVVEPEMLCHAPVAMDATGAQALQQVWAVLLRAFPDIQVAVEDVIAEADALGCRPVGSADLLVLPTLRSRSSRRRYRSRADVPGARLVRSRSRTGE